MSNDFYNWTLSSAEPKAYLYEVTIRNDEQRELRVELRRNETPVGRGWTTFASFTYDNTTNGTYRLEWMVSGRQDSEFIRVAEQPKKFLLKLVQARDLGVPRLQIMAVEGMESAGVLVATGAPRVP